MLPYTVLIVEDFQAFRRFVDLTLKQKAEVGLVYQAADGLEGVQLAEKLRPDLVILDLGLPKLNGLEVARRIRSVSPESKILFLTQESSDETLNAAMLLGGRGYVLKVNMATEFLAAVDAVLEGKRFVGNGLRQNGGNPSEGNRSANSLHLLESQPLGLETGHIAATYRDETSLVNGFVRFIETALKAGNPVIVIATASHLASIRQRLEAEGWDISAATQESSYIPLIASDALATFMVNDWPHPVQVWNAVGDLVSKAAKIAKCEKPRVKACGEMSPILLARGNGEAAIQLEHLTNEITKSCDVDILCGYMLNDLQTRENREIFEKICGQHSTVHAMQ